MQRMTRLRDDRGAVAVWVAILMIPLMVMAALAIDIGAAHADRQRLQHGADAAALAIAQECAVSGCADEDATAQQLATANQPQNGVVDAEVVELDEAAGYVEVETSSERDFWFAPVIGEDDVAQTRVGAASWGYPSGGGSLPLTFSWCEVLHYTGATAIRDSAGAIIGLDIHGGRQDVVLYNKSNQSSNFHSCSSGAPMPSVPNGLAPSGGFGWLVESGSTSCSGMETDAGGWYSSDTGNDRPDHCTAAQLNAMIGQTILIPVFDGTNGLTGSNAKYHVFGYIAFKFKGFFFGNGWSSPVAPCGNPNRCISGDIVEFVDYASGFDTSPNGPQLGSALVQLRLPGEG